MPKSILQTLLGAAILATALAGGWFLTNQVQRSVPLTGELSACWRLDGSADQVGCLSDRFVDGADEAAAGIDGIARDEAVIEFVRSQESSAAGDPRLAGTCHPAMHELGRAEGTRAATESRAPTFPGGSSQLCTAGYVHGLSEGYLVGTPASDVARVFPELCHDEAAQSGCAHGIGHALLRARVDDKPVAAAAGAADRCGDLPDEFPSNCTNGVYMELAMRTEPTAVEPTTYVNSCRGAANVEAELSCWSYLGLNLSTNDIALDQVTTWCAKATLPGQFKCIDEYGRDLGIERVAMCEQVDGPPELRERCIDGAVGLQVGSGHVSTKVARSECGALDSPRLELFCTDAVERYAKGRKLVEGS